MILKTKPFMPNNIELRELSSMCISKYKESQANALNELISNPTHEFSKTAREILLLNYDIWFRWLVEVEDVLRRRVHTDNIPSIIMRISDALEREYTSTLLENSETFEKDYVQVWLEAHAFIYEYLRAKIHHLTTEDLPKFMIDVTDTLILVMDNTLFELHEIDNLFNGGDLFVSFDDICIDYKKIVGTEGCLITDRLGVYCKHFNLESQYLTIKDYSVGEKTLHDKRIASSVYTAVNGMGYKVKAII